MYTSYLLRCPPERLVRHRPTVTPARGKPSSPLCRQGSLASRTLITLFERASHLRPPMRAPQPTLRPLSNKKLSATHNTRSQLHQNPTFRPYALPHHQHLPHAGPPRLLLGRRTCTKSKNLALAGPRSPTIAIGSPSGSALPPPAAADARAWQRHAHVTIGLGHTNRRSQQHICYAQIRALGCTVSNSPQRSTTAMGMHDIAVNWHAAGINNCMAPARTMRLVKTCPVSP